MPQNVKRKNALQELLSNGVQVACLDYTRLLAQQFLKNDESSIFATLIGNLLPFLVQVLVNEDLLGLV